MRQNERNAVSMNGLQLKRKYMMGSKLILKFSLSGLINKSKNVYYHYLFIYFI